jgi:hypothetical protein
MVYYSRVHVLLVPPLHQTNRRRIAAAHRTAENLQPVETSERQGQLTNERTNERENQQIKKNNNNKN